MNNQKFLTKYLKNQIIIDLNTENLDYSSASDLLTHISLIMMSSRATNLILNLKNVSFIDAKGLFALMEAQTLMQEKEGKLILIVPKISAYKILKSVKTLDTFEIFRSEKALNQYSLVNALPKPVISLYNIISSHFNLLPV